MGETGRRVAIGIAVAVGLVAVAAGAAWWAAWDDYEDHFSPDLELRPAADWTLVAVTFSPTTGLHEGDEVRIASDAFAPHEVVEVLPCPSEARSHFECDHEAGMRVAVDPSGHLEATYAVPRRLGAGTGDCATRIPGCLLLVGTVADRDRVGRAPLRYAPTDGPPASRIDLRRVGRLDGSLEHLGGDRVAVSAEGFLPGEPVLVAVCQTEVTTMLPPTEACALDGDDLTVRELTEVAGVGDRADDAGGARLTIEVPAAIRAYEEDEGNGLDPLVFRCDVEPSPCVVLLAAAADLRRSAVVPLAP